MANANEQHGDGAQFSERFMYLHGLWLALDGLAAMISQHWETGWAAAADDADRQALRGELAEYGGDIVEAMSVVERGDATCPLIKEAAVYVNAIDLAYRDALQHADFCVVEEGADFADAFYTAFLSRVGPLAAGLTLLAAKIEGARGPALAAADCIEVDLTRLRLKRGAARSLFEQLCEPGAWPGGVRMKNAPIAARALRETLRGKPPSTGGREIADTIKSRDGRIWTTRPLRKSGDTQ